MSRIYKIYRISKIIGAGDRSSGAPAPERRIGKRTPAWPVARGPVPRDRPRAPETVVRERLLPNGALGGEPCLARSAGACPPRSFDLRENRPPAKAVFRFDRGMARDRPSPYGKLHAFLTVARGPVPRDRTTCAKTERQPTPFPRPRHGEGQALALR